MFTLGETPAYISFWTRAAWKCPGSSVMKRMSAMGGFPWDWPLPPPRPAPRGVPPSAALPMGRLQCDPNAEGAAGLSSRAGPPVTTPPPPPAAPPGETVGLLVEAAPGPGVLHQLTGVIARHGADITLVEILENRPAGSRTYFEVTVP